MTTETIATLTASLADALSKEAGQAAKVKECKDALETQADLLDSYRTDRRAIEAKIKALRARPKKSDAGQDDGRPAFLDRKPAA